MKYVALLLLAGCSFSVVRERGKLAPPIVDTVGIAATYAMHRYDEHCPYDDIVCEQPSSARKATQILVGAVFLASAIYGYIVYADDAASP